ncbi:FYVE, RhoGEF and PH domain-containing protein 6-like isoform X2 [Syngnathoides biaculeatus]|uniref:FYVE, RhoGEF and PH domain-containing protein 6-like isoform X2 n=1 Tax=Syngnathoides biaculeatus TaxID=300417 RepID=UPI002ADE4451|nr:FYVE, RhoGEF and PH domain-containing protein 6-like isoform X2 [Syngnathoides biaculeatus]
MKSGTQKPPLAPKPKLSPLQPGAPSDRSLGSSHKVKPRLAPKPDLSELNSKPVASKIPSNAVGKSPPEPNWDRILPVCLCSQQNCRCVRDSHVNGTLQQVKGPQNGKTASPERKADRAKRAIAHASTLNGRLENRRAPRGTSPALGVRVGREITQDRAAPVPEADANVSEQKQQPVIPRKPSPVPVPRRLKTTWLAHQEKAEDETLIQEGRRRVQELKVSSEGKGVTLTAAGKGASPAPTPRKKSHLVTSPAPSPLQNNLDEEEDLGCDVNAGQTEMEQSVDEEGEGEARRTSDRDGRDSSLRSCGPDHPNDGAPELVPRSNSPTAWLKKTQSLEVEEDLKSGASVENQTTVTRDLPPLPGNRSRTATRRPGSFSAADSVCSQGARKSFRKRLDLRLSAMMLSKVTAKGSQTAESGQRDGPQNVRGALGAGGGFSRPLVGLEQSVDGDERDLDYENICHYEEVSDYENVYFGGSEGSGTTWQSLDDDGGGIYEYPEAYLSPDENADDDDDGSADEDASDADFTPPFSDEDDWSLSSHDDVAHSEENALQSGPRMSKSHHVATEIMTSEKVFVDVLKLLHVDFRDAVAKASRQSDKAVIEDGVLNQILYYLPQLYQLNRDLLRELRSRLAKWDEKEQVADIFVKKGPYLKMYSAYIRQFDKNVALLEEHSKKNAAFAGVVRQFEASPRCANLALKHYLLKPVQRIPQYQLLFRDYLKNLSEDSADYKDTQAALAVVEEVASHANDIMKQGDNFQKLMEVQCRLSGRHEIVGPGRIFLKEGVLNKLSRKVMQPRMFFLFNDTLLYTTPVQSGQYKWNNLLSLAGMKVSKPSPEAHQNEFTIESVERSFILSASSPAERDEWLEALSAAVGDYTKKKISFISGKSFQELQLSGDDAPLGSKAPIWIPDPRATMCMICTCEFTLTWRRHHCRACGKVVCQSCSSNKQSLEYLKNQFARVCDQCDAVLREKRGEEDPPAGGAVPKASSFAFSRKHKRIPAALKEVSASTGESSMSGYLQRSKGKKKAKRLWFVVKDKVLYTYAASEDVAALESQPLLGFVLKVDSAQMLHFKLYHKNTLYYNFKADDARTAQRWIETFRQSAVL